MRLYLSTNCPKQPFALRERRRDDGLGPGLARAREARLQDNTCRSSRTSHLSRGGDPRPGERRRRSRAAAGRRAVPRPKRASRCSHGPIEIFVLVVRWRGSILLPGTARPSLRRPFQQTPATHTILPRRRFVKSRPWKAPARGRTLFGRGASRSQKRARSIDLAAHHRPEAT